MNSGEEIYLLRISSTDGQNDYPRRHWTCLRHNQNIHRVGDSPTIFVQNVITIVALSLINAKNPHIAIFFHPITALQRPPVQFRIHSFLRSCSALNKNHHHNKMRNFMISHAKPPLGSHDCSVFVRDEAYWVTQKRVWLVVGWIDFSEYILCAKNRLDWFSMIYHSIIYVVTNTAHPDIHDH